MKKRKVFRFTVVKSFARWRGAAMFGPLQEKVLDEGTLLYRQAWTEVGISYGLVIGFKASELRIENNEKVVDVGEIFEEEERWISLLMKGPLEGIINFY